MGDAKTILKAITGRSCFCAGLCGPCRDQGVDRRVQVARLTPGRVVLTTGEAYDRPQGSAPRPGDSAVLDGTSGALITHASPSMPARVPGVMGAFVPPAPDQDAWQRPVVIGTQAFGISTADGPALIGERDPALEAKKGIGVLSFIRGEYYDDHPLRYQSIEPLFPTMAAELGNDELGVWPFPLGQGCEVGSSFNDWVVPEGQSFNWRYRIDGTDSRAVTGTLVANTLSAPLSRPEPQWNVTGQLALEESQSSRVLRLAAQGHFYNGDGTNGTRDQLAPISGSIAGETGFYVGGSKGWQAPLTVGLEHYMPAGQAAKDAFDQAYQQMIDDGLPPEVPLPARLVLLSPVQFDANEYANEQNDGADFPPRLVRERVYPKGEAVWIETPDVLWRASSGGESWTNLDFQPVVNADSFDPAGERARGFFGLGYGPTGGARVLYDPGAEYEFPDDYCCANNIDAETGYPVQVTPLSRLLTNLAGVLPREIEREFDVVAEAELQGVGRFEVRAPNAESLTTGDHRDHLQLGAFMTLGGSPISGRSWALLRAPGGEVRLVTMGSDGTGSVYQPNQAPAPVNFRTLVADWLALIGRPLEEGQSVNVDWLESNLRNPLVTDHVRVIADNRAWILSAWDAFRDGTSDDWGGKPRTLSQYREIPKTERPAGPAHGLAVVAEVPAPTPDSAGLPRYGREPALLLHVAGPGVWPWGTEFTTDAPDERDSGTEPLESPMQTAFPTELPLVIVGRMRAGTDPVEGETWRWSLPSERRVRWRPFVLPVPNGLGYDVEADGPAPLIFPDDVEHLAAYIIDSGIGEG